MMTIGNVVGSGHDMRAGMSRSMQEDSVSKGIQKQIENAQKKLQDLSANEEMALEDKMKKRQEIQQEITSLNQQLRQHQIEMRKKQQSQGTSMKETAKGKRGDGTRANSKSGGMSQASMQAMISADTSMKQAQVQGGVATQLEGKALILEGEIKMDESRGASVEKKKEELADIQQNAQRATAGQMSALVEANQAMKEASAAEQGSGKDKEDAYSKANAAEQNGKKVKGTVQKEEGTPGNEANGVNIETAAKPTEMAEGTAAAPELTPPVYDVSIDVRL